MAYRAPTSSILVCRGYPCDSDHNDTLYFATRTAQWTYMKSLVKYTYSAQSYQRYAKNTLRIQQRADDLYDCNYLIFSNVALTTSMSTPPTAQIFYAFIDRVEYINDNCTEVVYTIDPIQTYWFQFNMGECYVEREHTETDNVYGNLTPENININAYYSKELSTYDLLRFDETGAATNVDLWSVLFIYVPNGRFIGMYDPYVSSTGSKTDIDNYKAQPTITAFETSSPSITNATFTGEIKNKTYAAAKFFFLHLPPFSSTSTTLAKIRTIIATAEKVFESSEMANPTMLSVLLVPRIMAQNAPFSLTATLPELNAPDANTATLSVLKQITRPTALNGPASQTYTPRNKKLLSYPFCSLKIDNNNGDSKEFAWEYVDGITAAIQIKGVVVGAPEVVAYPSIYNGESNKYAENGVFIKDFVNTLWTQDSYQLYLNNNANSMMFGFITSAIGMVVQAYTGNYVGAVGTAVGMGSQIAALEDRKSMPDKITGSLSYSALRNVVNTYHFSFEQLNLYLPAAQRIDHYFDLYGYAIEDIKVPNIKASGVTLRPVWNYVKTRDAVILPVPGSGINSSIAIDEIKAIRSIFDRGVRFWSDASKVGKYTANSNAPVTPTP